MKKVFLTVALVATFFVSNAQTQKVTKLVADETELTTGASSFKITTVNDKILNSLIAKYGVKKYTVSIKKDRMGMYREYMISFKNAMQHEVEQFLKSK